MKTINVSLTRAHKLVERVTREIGTVQHQILKLLVPVNVNVESDTSQVTVRLAKILAAEKLADSLYEVLESIRKKVAEKNSSSGIYTLLAEKAVLVKKQQDLENIARYVASHNRADVISANDAQSYWTRIQTSENLKSFSVKVIDDAELDVYQEKVKNIVSQLDVISDAINDKNASTKVSFELNEEIAKLIGL